MKHVIAAIATSLFFISAYIPAKAEDDAASLEISIADCRDLAKPVKIGQIKLLQGRRVLETLRPEYYNRQIIRNLDTGRYVLEFQNVFGRFEKTEVWIKEYKLVRVKVCVNQNSMSKPILKPFIDQMKGEDILVVKLFSQAEGIYYGHKQITITRSGQSWLASYKDKVLVLSESQLGKLRQFEQEAAMMDGKEGCPTEDAYSFIYHKQLRTSCDQSCNWEGARFLVADLFGD